MIKVTHGNLYIENEIIENINDIKEVETHKKIYFILHLKNSTIKSFRPKDNKNAIGIFSNISSFTILVDNSTIIYDYKFPISLKKIEFENGSVFIDKSPNYNEYPVGFSFSLLFSDYDTLDKNHFQVKTTYYKCYNKITFDSIKNLEIEDTFFKNLEFYASDIEIDFLKCDNVKITTFPEIDTGELYITVCKNVYFDVDKSIDVNILHLVNNDNLYFNAPKLTLWNSLSVASSYNTDISKLVFKNVEKFNISSITGYLQIKDFNENSIKNFNVKKIQNLSVGNLKRVKNIFLNDELINLTKNAENVSLSNITINVKNFNKIHFGANDNFIINELIHFVDDKGEKVSILYNFPKISNLFIYYLDKEINKIIFDNPDIDKISIGDSGLEVGEEKQLQTQNIEFIFKEMPKKSFIFNTGDYKSMVIEKSAKSLEVLIFKDLISKTKNISNLKGRFATKVGKMVIGNWILEDDIFNKVFPEDPNSLKEIIFTHFLSENDDFFISQFFDFSKHDKEFLKSFLTYFSQTEELKIKKSNDFGKMLNIVREIGLNCKEIFDKANVIVKIIEMKLKVKNG